MRKTIREFGVATAAMWLGLYLGIFFALTTTAQAGLVAYWNMDEAVGSTALNDLAGGDNTAFSEGNAEVAAGGKFGNALSLDGTSGTYAQAPETGLPFGAGTSATVSVWFNKATTNSDMVLFVYGDDSVGQGRGLWDRNSTTATYFHWAGPDVNGTHGPFGVGTWHHMAGVYDHLAGTIAIYVDGSLLNSGSATPNTTSAGLLQIGTNQGSELNTKRFNGYLDDIAVWDEALDSDDIAFLWNNGTGRVATAFDSDGDGVPDDHLSVDFGAPGGSIGTQIGYSAFDSYDLNPSGVSTMTFTSSLGNEGTVAVSVFTTSTLAGTPTHGFRDRSPITGLFAGVSDLLGDHVKANSLVLGGGFETLNLQLAGLQAGNYQITTYHHDAAFQVGALNVFVEDANGTATVVTNFAQSSGTAPASVASLTFSFASDGTDPVTLRFEEIDGTSNDPTGNYNEEAALNGFTIEDMIIDSDGDGVPDDQDICPGGDDNVDADGDAVPDFCDPCPDDAENDADGDGVCGDVDACPGGDDNQNADGDSLPDFCDVCPLDAENDADGDGICANDDNCPLIANENQADLDEDLVGDACDDDIDGDGVPNTGDNCAYDANPEQTDTDGDGAGDVCDDDVDGDGVLDADDACVPSPVGDAVNADGCAIGELCPCAHPDGADRWKNHGAYVSCVAHASNDFVAAGLISDAEKDAIQSAAGESSCGHKNK